MEHREYTREEAARIEQHTQAAFEEREARREHYREARKIRIADGIIEHGDLVSDHDVVCPHCGAWAEGDATLSMQSAPQLVTQCGDCKRKFLLEVRLRCTYTTSKVEPDE